MVVINCIRYTNCFFIIVDSGGTDLSDYAPKPRALSLVVDLGILNRVHKQSIGRKVMVPKHTQIVILKNNLFLGTFLSLQK